MLVMFVFVKEFVFVIRSLKFYLCKLRAQSPNSSHKLPMQSGLGMQIFVHASCMHLPFVCMCTCIKPRAPLEEVVSLRRLSRTNLMLLMTLWKRPAVRKPPPRWAADQRELGGRPLLPTSSVVPRARDHRLFALLRAPNGGGHTLASILQEVGSNGGIL